LIDLCRPPGTAKREWEVKHNGKLKLYPDGRNSLTVASKPIFLEAGYELVGEKEKIPKPKNMGNEVRSDNLRRARQTVMDIARLNGFKWFVTWTLDAKLIDRYDPKAISRKVKTFLGNMVKRRNAMYLLIPELHRDGAIHMHGLLSGDFIMEDSGHKRKSGQRVYNMPDWKFGFSTAIEIDDNVGAISRYIAKYISKNFRKIFGSFYYAGGHGLTRKPLQQLYDLDYHGVNAKEYRNGFVGFKYQNFEEDDETTNFILEHMEEDTAYEYPGNHQH
jgi:hypothetical protein